MWLITRQFLISSLAQKRQQAAPNFLLRSCCSSSTRDKSPTSLLVYDSFGETHPHIICEPSCCLCVSFLLIIPRVNKAAAEHPGVGRNVSWKLSKRHISIWRANPSALSNLLCCEHDTPPVYMWDRGSDERLFRVCFSLLHFHCLLSVPALLTGDEGIKAERTKQQRRQSQIYQMQTRMADSVCVCVSLSLSLALCIWSGLCFALSRLASRARRIVAKRSAPAKAREMQPKAHGRCFLVSHKTRVHR